MRKLIMTGTVALAMGAGLFAGTGSALAATNSVAPMSSSSAAIQGDGCTGVPDSSFGADYGPACNAHDACYDAGSSTPRLACDQTLEANLKDACQRESYAVSLCNAQAVVYYNGVRALGKSHYAGSGDPS